MALYDKVVKLSMKSMTETNSGKLISLISADLFSAERGLAAFPIIFAGPFINILAYYLLAREIGYIYTFVLFGLWMFLIFIQFLMANYSRKMKFVESHINDNRLKLINDLVVGSRTIKCYGWENHYIDKIGKHRRKQMGHVLKLNAVQAFGSAFF